MGAPRHRAVKRRRHIAPHAAVDVAVLDEHRVLRRWHGAECGQAFGNRSFPLRRCIAYRSIDHIKLGNTVRYSIAIRIRARRQSRVLHPLHLHREQLVCSAYLHLVQALPCRPHRAKVILCPAYPQSVVLASRFLLHTPSLFFAADTRKPPTDDRGFLKVGRSPWDEQISL